MFLSAPAFNSQTPAYEPDNKEDTSELEMCVTCRWLVSVSYLLGDRPPWVLADSPPSTHVATGSSKQWAWPGVCLQKTGHKYTMTSPLQWDSTQSQKVVFKGYLNWQTKCSWNKVKRYKNNIKTCIWYHLSYERYIVMKDTWLWKILTKPGEKHTEMSAVICRL